MCIRDRKYVMSRSSEKIPLRSFINSTRYIRLDDRHGVMLPLILSLNKCLLLVFWLEEHPGVNRHIDDLLKVSWGLWFSGKPRAHCACVYGEFMLPVPTYVISDPDDISFCNGEENRTAPAPL